MTNSHSEFLTQFGWNDFFENQLTEFTKSNPGFVPGDLLPARVINEERNLYRLQFNAQDILWSAITGKMQFEARSREDFPAVGDWVLAEIPNGSEKAIIRFIFKRKSALMRKQVGSSSDVQILSTNVDTVFITTSLNAELNMGRIDRYLTFAWDSGAVPVILLTKSDLCSDVDEVLLDLKLRFPAVEIFALSKDQYAAAEFLKSYLSYGKTSVLVGSSGVGKSTLSNFLIGSEVITTKEIREGDDKGKHTTTSRSLYVSQFGGLIIDTPGMRELQFADHEEGLQLQYSDVEELIGNCRYNNCSHQGEKGCAVIEALESGFLLEERWKSYRKIQSEIRHSLRKQDKVLLSEDRKIWKKRSIAARRRYSV